MLFILYFSFSIMSLLQSSLGVAMWVWLDRPATCLPTNAGRVEILSLLVCKSLTLITHSPHRLACRSHKKNLHLYILITFLPVFCMNIPNSCMNEKDKCYVFLNVLKFEEYIVYVKIRVWIWWKYWIINLSFNSPKSLLNFVNLFRFSNLLNLKALS